MKSLSKIVERIIVLDQSSLQIIHNCDYVCCMSLYIVIEDMVEW